MFFKAANFSSAGIAYEAIVPGLGDLGLLHFPRLLANPEHALIEGWAEFVEILFNGGTPFGFTQVKPFSGADRTLGPPPANRGESVEGAFANGLYGIFRRQVVQVGVPQPLPPGTPLTIGGPTTVTYTTAFIPETVNGDLMATPLGGGSPAPWLRDQGVRLRFLLDIWVPLKRLGPLANPKTTDFLREQSNLVPTEWHNLRSEWYRENIGLVQPTVTAVTPTVVQAFLPATLSITGTNFVAGSQVFLGPIPATSVTVVSSTQITASFGPLPAGPQPVFVNTFTAPRVPSTPPFQLRATGG